jgi:FAR-17a/AIG1-like protein
MVTTSSWSRFWWELRPSYELFSLGEPTLHEGDADNNTIVVQIDVLQSFAPVKRCFWPCWTRAFLLAWSVQVLGVDVRHYPPHNLWIYYGYLTHWGHTLSIIYLSLSFLCSVVPKKLLIVPNHSTEKAACTSWTAQSPSRLVCITWGLYSTVAPLEIAICFLYWSAVANAPPSYVSVMEHGGIAALVLLDGTLIGHVPVRIKHGVFLMSVCFSYLTWSLLDAELGIGNGEWGPAYNDDALYPVLNWNDDFRGAAIVSAVAICILAPTLFWVCWLLSLVSPPRKDADAIENGNASHGCCTFEGSRRHVLTFHTSDVTAAYKNMSAL